MGLITAPDKLPRWADGGSAKINEPSEAKKDIGWIEERPSFQHFNWILNKSYEWIAYMYVKVATFFSRFEKQTNPKNIGLADIAYSDTLGLFCAVGFTDSDAYILTSPDGKTWTEQSNPKPSALESICWSDTLGLFCAVGQPDATDAYIITSPDGTTWTERSNPKAVFLWGVNWSNDLGLFCAVGDGDGTDSYLLTSPDGVTWTERSTPTSSTLREVEWSSSLGLFAAFGINVITSPDGITWTERTLPSINMLSLTWSENLGLFIGIGSNGIFSSITGTSWEYVAVDFGGGSPGNSPLKVKRFDSIGVFVAVGYNFTTDAAFLIASPDGFNWDVKNTEGFIRLNSIAYSNDLNVLCSVGSGDGSEAEIITSSYNVS